MKKTLLTSVILFFGTLSLLGQEESTELVSENWGDYYFVNQNYDEGEIILQEKCVISKKETLDTLTKKIRNLEHKYFPIAIEKILKINFEMINNLHLKA